MEQLAGRSRETVVSRGGVLLTCCETLRAVLGAAFGWCHLRQRLHGGLQRLAQRVGPHDDPC